MKPRGRRFLFLCSAALYVIVFAAAAAETLGELQARFDRESNSDRKAKILEKLGDAQFSETRRAGAAGDYNAIGLILEKYRNNVRAALDALKKDHPDAERHYRGYRQVEMSVRQGIHEVDQIVLLAPDEYKPPIGLVRRDLAAMQDELIAALFPTHHLAQPPPPISPKPPSEKQP
jgi:hypothetical protein